MKIILTLSLILNLGLLYYSFHGKNPEDFTVPSSVLDDGYLKQEFSTVLAIDLYSSMGNSWLVDNRKGWASRMLVADAMLDPKVTDKLSPLAAEILVNTLTENSSREEAERELRRNFEGVTKIDVNVENNGFRKLYFYGGDYKTIKFVVWGVRDGLFHTSDDREEVVNQIDRFIHKFSANL